MKLELDRDQEKILAQCLDSEVKACQIKIDQLKAARVDHIHVSVAEHQRKLKAIRKKLR